MTSVRNKCSKNNESKNKFSLDRSIDWRSNGCDCCQLEMMKFLVENVTDYDGSLITTSESTFDRVWAESQQSIDRPIERDLYFVSSEIFKRATRKSKVKWVIIASRNFETILMSGLKMLEIKLKMNSRQWLPWCWLVHGVCSFRSGQWHRPHCQFSIRVLLDLYFCDCGICDRRSWTIQRPDDASNKINGNWAQIRAETIGKISFFHFGLGGRWEPLNDWNETNEEKCKLNVFSKQK